MRREREKESAKHNNEIKRIALYARGLLSDRRFFSCIIFGAFMCCLFALVQRLNIRIILPKYLIVF